MCRTNYESGLETTCSRQREPQQHGAQAIVHIGKCEKKARLLGKVCTAPKTIEDVIRSAQKAQVTAGVLWLVGTAHSLVLQHDWFRCNS